MRMRIFSILVLWALAAASSVAQQTTGTITGTVVDSSGAAVTAAEVKLNNAEAGIRRVAQSDDVGNFRFLLLPPGLYSIEASHAGFKMFRREGIVVEADRSLGV